MSQHRPFIPQNKPRLWVIFMLAGLIGMGAGLLGFLAAWFGLPWLSAPLIIVFFACWGTAAVSWFGFAFGMLTGRYSKLVARPWKEQVW